MTTGVRSGKGVTIKSRRGRYIEVNTLNVNTPLLFVRSLSFLFVRSVFVFLF